MWPMDPNVKMRYSPNDNWRTDPTVSQNYKTVDDDNLAIDSLGIVFAFY